MRAIPTDDGRLAHFPAVIKQHRSGRKFCERLRIHVGKRNVGNRSQRPGGQHESGHKECDNFMQVGKEIFHSTISQ